MKEPTYSQVSAALKEFFPTAAHDDHTPAMRDIMKRALMAAQKVDPNVYGDMHYGWGTDGVHFMCNSVEAQRKLSQWHHDSTATVPGLRQRMEEVGRRLIDQSDEPTDWTNYASRMNYWRDKAIKMARNLGVK